MSAFQPQMLMNPGPRPQEISFQEFKTALLARGQVRSSYSRCLNILCLLYSTGSAAIHHRCRFIAQSAMSCTLCKANLHLVSLCCCYVCPGGSA
jgi:hypothetical protein